eukprot:10324906-Ditylum_brightwellii.AAC.1
METLPFQVDKYVELPYIGNLAVANKMHHQKVESTLIQLAKEIGSKWIKLPYFGTDTVEGGGIGSTLLGKWFPPSYLSISPGTTPFLFLYVECDDYNALLFYKQLSFDEVKSGQTEQFILHMN